MAIDLDFDDLLNPFFFHFIPEKKVCGHCLNDLGLKAFLTHRVPPNSNECSYCVRVDKTVDVDELQRHILKFFPYGIADEELPIDYLKEDEGLIWQDQWDTLEKFVGPWVCDELYGDLEKNLVDARYCQCDWSALTPLQQRNYQWKEFKEVIQPFEDGFKIVAKTPREERNHDEPHPNDFYNAIAVYLCRADALSILPQEETSEIHRVQWGKIKDELTFSRLTSPPDDKPIQSNRFSPSGVSMFYGAKDFDTACLEINAEDGDDITHAIFTPKRDLTLIDFTAAKFPCGKFDDEWIGNYHISEFLKGFLSDIRQEAKGEGCPYEYVPTQAICHFFKQQGAEEILKLNMNNPALSPVLLLMRKHQQIDGFCFRSSKGTERTCYVLFCDNEESKELLELSNVSFATFNPKANTAEVIKAAFEQL